ncbi:hypothetical protein JRQ81_000888 [Phrynocephalus forsythii]|uniref:RRM domain-containing protein n=1 Tax=Phrynocephalus forsythii TaxID=171643 RepID=A0A9Q0YAK4_9SAUR|nr:hypothetical protein JRQ81_000888 [Phrynocephalus forsythii]
MSCLPYLDNNTHGNPPFYAWPWFQRNYPVYEPAVFSVVPFYFHPSVYLSTPEIYDPGVVLPLSNMTYQHQSKRSYNNYCRYTPAELNACKIVLEKTSTVHSSSGQQIVSSCQLSSSCSEKGRFSEDTVHLIASSDHSDGSTTKQRESSVERDQYKSTILNGGHRSECCETSESNNISGEFNARISCSSLNKTSYFSALELNLTEENMSSSPSEELEPAQEKQKNTPILANDATVENDSSMYTNADFSHSSESETDEGKSSGLDDESQLEYHSAEEENCVCHGSFYRQEAKILETSQNKKLANKKKYTDQQQYFNKLENESSNSGFKTVDNDFSKISELPHMFQDGKYTTSSSLSSGDQEKDETLGTFHSIVSEDSFIAKANKEKHPESFSTNKIVIEENMVENSLTDITQTPITASDRKMCKQNEYSSTDAFEKTRNLHLLHHERAFLPPASTYGGDPEISDPCSYDQWVVVNAKERKGAYKSCGRCRRCKEDIPNSELECITYLNTIASKNQSTVNQAVDASSDFRACFTTSRATSVKVPVISRGQNTVITMMSKLRPKEWLTENRRSVACNTDLSYLSGYADMTDSQTACESFAATHGWQSKNKDLMEYKNRTAKDFDEIPERMMQISEDTVSHSPNCCKEIWQRAMKAEMELLKIRCQMHHQHCCPTCSSVMEEMEHVNSSGGSGNSVTVASCPQNVEASSHPVVAHALSENSCPQLSNGSSVERNSCLVENRLSHTEEISEDWFDATENLTVTNSSLSLTETQTAEDRKKESKNIFCIHVGSLSPLVSEADLWFCFQKYNVSKISIYEHSDSYRYASLGFKSACDAKLAVKEMNEKEIKGKAVKVRLVKTVQENCSKDCQDWVKQEPEKQRLHASSKKSTKCEKNRSAILKVPASASGDPIIPAGGTSSDLKMPSVSKNPSQSSLPPPTSIPRPISASSKSPLYTSAPSKVPSSDSQSSKPTLGNTCFEIDQEDTAEGLLLLGSVQCTPNPSSTFVPPNTLSLRSFCKIVKKLEELHPEFSRDSILNALTEIKENKGLLSGLPLSTIVQMTSSLLNKKFTSKSNGNQGNNLKNK